MTTELILSCPALLEILLNHIWLYEICNSTLTFPISQRKEIMRFQWLKWSIIDFFQAK